MGGLTNGLPVVGSGGAGSSPLSALGSLPVVGGLTSGLPVAGSGGAGSSPLGAVGSLPVIGGLASNLPIVGGGAGASPLNASLPIVGRGAGGLSSLLPTKALTGLTNGLPEPFSALAATIVGILLSLFKLDPTSLLGSSAPIPSLVARDLPSLLPALPTGGLPRLCAILTRPNWRSPWC